MNKYIHYLDKPLITYVPGTGATVLAEAAHVGHSFHEEIAYGVAHGAAFVGRPSFCLMKSHGVAKAMNAVIASLAAGTSAPMIGIVFDDPSGKTSDHAFCARTMLEGAGAWVTDSVEQAFQLSERYRVPTFFCTAQAIEIDWKAFLSRSFPRIEKRIALLNPLQSEWQQRRALARSIAKTKDAEFHFNEALPELNCPGSLPPHLKSTAESYEPWIAELKKAGFDWVTGDAGTSSLFGLPPHLFMDVTTYMGGSIPLAIGATLCGYRTLAVTGDFSFLSTGALGMMEAHRRNLSIHIAVLCNQKAAATGGQEVSLEWVKSSIPSYVEVKAFQKSPSSEFRDFFTKSDGIKVGLISV